MAELESGERVRCIGSVAALRALRSSDTERVYNIEVDGDHCYRVGESGMLVRNDSVAPCDNAEKNQHFPISRDGRTYTGKADYLIPSNKRVKDPQVCRVHSIKGPLLKVAGKTPQDKRDADNVRRRVNSLLVHDTPLVGKVEIGHLIVDFLGGPNAPENMVPLHDQLNNASPQYYGLLEKWIGRCLTGSLLGEMSVVGKYNDSAAGVEKYISKVLKVTLYFTDGTAQKSHTFTFGNWPSPSSTFPNPPPSCV